MNKTFLNGYWTPTFCDIFLPTEDETDKTSFDKFKEMFDGSGIPLKITESNLQTLFYLLYARHGSDPIRGIDVNQFKYGIQSRIFMYGPAWEKRLALQDSLKELSVADAMKGGEAIYNTAQAPGTSTAGLVNNDGKLDFLNSQNTTTYKKTQLEGIASLNALLETDVTREFLVKFDDLFMVMPIRSHIPAYVTYEQEDE